jgi:hypothetical protein
MLTVNLDSALWSAGIVTEAAVVALLLWRRVWRVLPLFCVYSAWTLLSDAGAYAVVHFWPSSYLTTYLAEAVLDSLLQLTVLVELAWSLLRPLRTSLPRRSMVIVASLILALGALIWPFANIPGFGGFPPEWNLLVHLQQTVSILRILVFLGLAGCSHFLSIGWRNRELQVATGFGFYSLVSVAVAVLHTHQEMGPQYRRLDQLLVASYLCSLLYWTFSFAQKEEERQEFTPQMQNFLLVLAGNAHATRAALDNRSTTTQSVKREE